MSNFSDAQILAVWQKGLSVAGYDPAQYRKDICGSWMQYSAYGNRDSKYGWEIDHIKPESKGGLDHISNLQPLFWENNVAKGDKYPWP